jgi:hypothetical protein
MVMSMMFMNMAATKTTLTLTFGLMAMRGMGPFVDGGHCCNVAAGAVIPLGPGPRSARPRGLQ